MLGLDDPSETNVNLAIAELRRKSAHAPLNRYLKKMQLKREKKEFLDDLNVLNKTEKTLSTSRTESKLNEESISQIGKKFVFMQEKQKEYQKLQEKYGVIHQKNGFNKAHSHDSILGMSPMSSLSDL